MEQKSKEYSNAAFVIDGTDSNQAAEKSDHPTSSSNNFRTNSIHSTTSSTHSTIKSNHSRSVSTHSTSNSTHSATKSAHSATSKTCSAAKPGRSSGSSSSLSPSTAKHATEAADEQSDEGTYRLYKSRFYVLSLYALILFYQCAIWNTWGPISATALAVFPSWTEATIATFANWGPIMFVLFDFPTSWAIDRWGLRRVTLCFTGCTALAHMLRCVTIQETLFTVFANICGIVNGIEATITLASPALAAMWFPAAQRITATAFPQVLNVMGNGASFMQPLIVRAPGNDTTVEEMTHDIRTLMVIEMCIAVGLFLLVVVYFPSAPPSPPSPSSTVPRLKFGEGYREIAKNPKFWLLLVAYSVFTGVSMAWLGVITFSLQELGIDQDEAVWIGIYNSICTGVVCILTSRIVDFVYGHLKAALLFLMTLSSLCYIWFMMLTLEVWPVTDAQVYVAVLGGQSLNFACTPLFYELAVEATYPSPENGVGTLLTLSNNFVGAIFLFLFYIPGISDGGDAWMTYLLVASNVGAIFPVLFVKEEYKRSKLDRASLNDAP